MSLHSLETSYTAPPVAPEVQVDDTYVFNYKELQEFLGDTPTDVFEPVDSDAEIIDFPPLSGRVFDTGLHRQTEIVDPVRALAAQPTHVDFRPLRVTNPDELILAKMVEYNGCVKAEGTVSLLTHTYPY